MSSIFAFYIKTDNSLKVRRCVLVITSCEASSKSKEKKLRRMGKLLLPPSQFERLTTYRLTLDQLKRKKPKKMEKASNMA